MIKKLSTIEKGLLKKKQEEERPSDTIKRMANLISLQMVEQKTENQVLDVVLKQLQLLACTLDAITAYMDSEKGFGIVQDKS